LGLSFLPSADNQWLAAMGLASQIKGMAMLRILFIAATAVRASWTFALNPGYRAITA
jgi:hypothetical protein